MNYRVSLITALVMYRLRLAQNSNLTHSFKIWCYMILTMWVCELTAPDNLTLVDGGGGLVTKLCPTLVTPWTVAHQAPLSVWFSRQEYWSGLQFPSPGGSSQLRDRTCVSCFAGWFLTTEPPRKPHVCFWIYVKCPCLTSGGGIQPSMVKEREEVFVVVVV